MLRVTSLRRRMILTILLASSVCWILQTLWGGKDQVIASFRSLDAARLELSFLFGMAVVFVASYTYSLILSRINQEAPSALAITSFAVSQVVRYLPGRIWSVVYQTQATAAYVPVPDTVKANIENYVVVNLNSIAIAVSAFVLYKMGAMAALQVFSFSMIVMFCILRSSVFQKISMAAERMFLGSYKQFKRSSINNDLLIIVVLQAEWLFYFLASSLILPANFSVSDIIIVATCYTTASIVSAFAFVLPGGILLREASFIWLAGLFGYDPVIMFTFSIVVRILFTLSDVAGALFGLMVQKVSFNKKTLYECE